MTNENHKQCKSNGCYNPVLDGNYCEHCKQRRKEKRNTILAGAMGVGFLGGCVIKEFLINKKVPKIASKVMQVILRI